MPVTPWIELVSADTKEKIIKILEEELRLYNDRIKNVPKMQG